MKFENATVIVEKRVNGIQPAIYIVENGNVKLITITPNHDFDITDEGKLGERWDIDSGGKVKWCGDKNNDFEDSGKYMSRTKMIEMLQSCPGLKIGHCNFSNDEYIYSKEDGNVYDENGYLFEDWDSEGPHRHDGVRSRLWETGWFMYTDQKYGGI